MFASKRKLAFFDADETVLAMKSMLDFLRFFLEVREGERGGIRFLQIAADFRRRQAQGAPREILNKEYYKLFAGELESEMHALARAWYVTRWKNREDRFLSAGLRKLRSLQAEGYEVYLVSGSFRALLAPFSQELGVQGVLCGEPESVAGRFTGSLVGEPMIGFAKARAAEKLLGQSNVSLEYSFACGDDISDVPLLESVANASVVGRDPELLLYAREKGWEIL